MLVVSIVLYAISLVLMYFGIGNIAAMITKTVMLTAIQTVKAFKGQSTLPIEVDMGLAIIMAVVGLMLLGPATAFLVAFLIA